MAKKKTTSKKYRILIANGVNLDLLGTREPEIYGSLTLSDVQLDLEKYASSLQETEQYGRFELTFYQTNNEADFLAKISEKWDGCVMNPGAWTHTSLALGDRVKGLGLKFVEVHISNTYARENFRKTSFTAEHSRGVIIGAGASSYRIGLVAILEVLDNS